MQAAWKVTGEPKADAAAIATSEKLDYELFQRWLRFLAKPPKFYPYLAKWQEMIKEGGSEDEAKTLATEFQDLVVEVMFDARAIKEENDIIRAKALPGTKKKEKANLPNEFITNDDFCTGCGLELKSLPGDRVILTATCSWGTSPTARTPRTRRRSPSRRCSPSAARRSTAGSARIGAAISTIYGKTSRRSARRCRPSTPMSTGAGRRGTRADQVAVRGNPFKPGDEVARHFPSVLVEGEPRPS